jgi:hypothetical protein
MFGQMTAAIINYCTPHKLDDFLKPQDFMPSADFGRPEMSDDIEAVMERAVAYQKNQHKERR